MHGNRKQHQVCPTKCMVRQGWMAAESPTTLWSGTATIELMHLKLLLPLKLCTNPASKCLGTLRLMKFKCVPKCPAKHTQKQRNLI